MAKIKLCAGDRVKIEAGDYKGRLGVFIRATKTGLSMGYVAIDGDTKTERRLWLSSLSKVKASTTEEDSNTSSNINNNNEGEFVMVRRVELDRIISELSVLENRVSSLRITVDDLNRRPTSR